MRTLAMLVSLGIAAVALAGCSDSGAGDPPAQIANGETNGHQDGLNATLRFLAEDRGVVYANQTLSIGPEDACVPAGCATATVTGDHRGDFFKFIDLSDAIDPGMHAYVELEATMTRQNPVAPIGTSNLQWWPFGIWVTHTSATAESGHATLDGYVTRGDEPAQALFVVLDADQAQEYEVEVMVRVTPLDDRVQSAHVVRAGLQGTNASVTVDGDLSGDASLHVLHPDGSPLVSKTLSASDATAALPDGTQPGDYLLVVYGVEGPASLQVPQDDLLDPTDPIMETVDTGIQLGEMQDLPNNGQLTWDFDTDGSPYFVGITFDQLDGQGAYLDAHVTVTAPDGQSIIDREFDCQQCGWGISSTSTGSRLDLPAGTYTVTIDVETAGSWQVAEYKGEFRI